MKKIKLYHYTVNLDEKVAFWIETKGEAMQEALRGQTIPESLKLMLTEEKAKANLRIKNEEPNAKELARIMAPVIKAANDYNKFRQIDRLTELAELPYEEAVASYLADQTVDGLAFTNNKETKEIEERPNYKTYIKPYDFLNNLNTAAMPFIRDASRLYLDNTLRFWIKATVVNKPHHFNAAFNALRKQFKWDEEPSKTTMKKQLALVWKRMLGEEFAPTHKQIRTCDVMYIAASALSAVDAVNATYQYRICGDVDLINYIFMASVTCRNKGTYRGIPFF